MTEKLSRAFLFIMAALLKYNAYGDADADWESSFLGPNTFWGVETNGVRAALYIDPIVISNDVAIICRPILKNDLTNILWLYLPPMESRFQMELLDSNMNQVAKTLKGEELGKPFTEPFRLTTGINYDAGYTGVPPLRGQTELLSGSEFKLQDYFIITNSGQYHLIFQIKVIWFPPNWKGSGKTMAVPTVLFPPIDAQFEIKNP